MALLSQPDKLTSSPVKEQEATNSDLEADLVFGKDGGDIPVATKKTGTKCFNSLCSVIPNSICSKEKLCIFIQFKYD
jgi:hypothetical protein